MGITTEPERRIASGQVHKRRSTVATSKRDTELGPLYPEHSTHTRVPLPLYPRFETETKEVARWTNEKFPLTVCLLQSSAPPRAFNSTQRGKENALLQFHTFNKRIHHDCSTGNHHRDMHWREDELLQDGDEFELAREIPIQVGEATGSTEQDLTGLFEKRKEAPDVAIHEEVAHQP